MKNGYRRSRLRAQHLRSKADDRDGFRNSSPYSRSQPLQPLPLRVLNEDPVLRGPLAENLVLYFEEIGLFEELVFGRTGQEEE